MAKVFEERDHKQEFYNIIFGTSTYFKCNREKINDYIDIFDDEILTEITEEIIDRYSNPLERMYKIQKINLSLRNNYKCFHKKNKNDCEYCYLKLCKCGSIVNKLFYDGNHYETWKHRNYIKENEGPAEITQKKMDFIRRINYPY